MLETVIYIAEPELAQNEFEYLLRLVSEERREKISRFHFFRDARNSLMGDIIVRSEICKRTGLSNSALSFGKNGYGKPFLINNPRVHFNISHAGCYVAVAIDDKPVGIDIELKGKADTRVADRFFTVDEREYIYSYHENTRSQAFFEVWTKKEAYIKWESIGLSKPLSSFSVLSNDPKSIRYYRVFEDDWAICHVCTEQTEIPKCRLFSLSEVLH